jgi:2,4-dienoyl-CoA reductase-like NADH-dependent reductase (Old Yellow Enzyme family)
MHPMFDPLQMPSGHVLRNRLMLAPLTTQQSHPDGRVSVEDCHWLEMRAKGGFGLIVSAAAAVTADSRAFPGQYGTYSETFAPGLAGLAASVHRHGAVGLVQLQHGGGRSLKSGSQLPLAPSDTRFAKGASEADLAEVVDAFASGAERSVRAGFDGVQVHAAYGFLLAQFLDPEVNQRRDDYGGSLDGRARLLRQVIAAIRRAVPAALLSVRLNLRDRGLRPLEMLALAGELLVDGDVDHVDLVIEGSTSSDGQREELDYLRRISRGKGLLGVTGGFADAQSIGSALSNGADLVGIGTAAVLHADLPRRLLATPTFRARPLPVTPDDLARQGVSAPFLDYLSGLPGFVVRDRAAA